MSAQSIDYSTCSASDAAQAIITLELSRGIAYAASVRRGENHVREILQGVNAAVLVSLLHADDIKELVGDVLNGFKQQCHRMNLPFTVGNKKGVLFTSPREVKIQTNKLTEALDRASTLPATDASATDASATPAETATVTPAETATVTPAETATVTPAETATVTPAETVSADKYAALVRTNLKLLAERDAAFIERDNALAKLSTVQAQLEALLASAPMVEAPPAKKAKRA